MIELLTKQETLEDEWRGLYKDSWTGVICPESFQHPAKYSRALIRFIYQHVIECGWIKPGDHVVDPFGGVALGGFDAMRHGLHWTGCELEAKFHGLGNQNIALWNERFSRMPNWGTARLLNGDSRKLASVIRESVIAVSSPPYIEPCGHGGGKGSLKKEKSINEPQYGHTPGQIAEMPEGDLNLAISSPPYVGSLANAKNYADPEKAKSDSEREFMQHRSSTYADLRYGETDGNLGAMPNGDHAIAITSPPYNPPMSQDHNGSRGGQRGTTPSENGAFVKYGNTPGQLEGLSMDGFDAAISSPLYPQPHTSGGGINVEGYRNDKLRPGSEEKPFDLVGQRTYQGRGGERSEGNLETMDDTGFQAAISSPPWEEGAEGILRKEKFKNPEEFATRMAAGKYRNGKTVASVQGRLAQMERDSGKTYGDTENNLGNQRGEDFWSASRIILDQLHQVITPGGHAVFVVKSFVRDKKIVDFPAQWAQLCEAVGFRLLHDHHALLTEEHGTQTTFHGEDKTLTIARKSFFRRLAESKGSPRIDYENVLCFERPAR